MSVLRWAQLCPVPLLIFLWDAKAIVAQQVVVPDNTLGTQVQLDSPGQSFSVTGGVGRGVNLFHSFETFSPGTGAVRFDLRPGGFDDVKQIFTRVTGGEVSHIDGLLQTVGGNKPDLFLLNPHGIVFGPNARLDLGGSFVATTAEAIRFEDGFDFVTRASPSDALLSLSIPVGLQLGQNAGAIALTGPGHGIAVAPPGALPLPFEAAPADYAKGLQLSPGNTLALVSNGLLLDGGTLQSRPSQSAIPPGGVQFSLGSGRAGVVALQAHPQWDWALNYDSLSSASDIVFSNRARVDGTGFLPSTIQIDGHDVDLLGGSAIYSQNLGAVANGTVRFQARGRLFLEGTPNAFAMPSAIRNSVNDQGDGGNIEIEAGNLVLNGGANITTMAFSSSGNAGKIQIKVKDNLSLTGVTEASGFSPLITLINSTTMTAGNSGDINVEAGRLRIEDGAVISSSAFAGTGNSSNIQISAKDSVFVRGFNPSTQLLAGIASSSFSTGNAGNITIDTPRLSLFDSGAIEANIYASGVAGDITVNASEFVEIGGISPNNPSRFPSYIASTADLTENLLLRQIFQLPLVPRGTSGSVTITTPSLRLFEGGSVNTRNEGVGDAGSLRISASRIGLDEASLSASTAEGNGGNILLDGVETLTLRNGSLISASAGGQGNGGNIDIAARTVIAKPAENSDITANAVGNVGGEIMLDTSVSLGLEVRPQLTGRSDITASSNLGAQFNGTVEFAQPNTMPDSALVALPNSTLEPVERLAQGCNVGEAEFRITGRGGLARSPLDLLELDPLVSEQWEHQALLTKIIDKPTAEQLKQGARMQPAREAAGLVEAIALRDQGFYPQALAKLQALSQARLLPQESSLQVQVLRQLGITYRLLGEFDFSQTALKQSLAIAQEQSLLQEGAATTLSLGHLAQAKGEFEQAKKLYKHVLSGEPDASLGALTLASLMGLGFDQQQWGEAQQWRQRLMQQLDSQPDSSSAIAARLQGVALQLEILQGGRSVEESETLAVLYKDLQAILTWARLQGDQQVLAYALGYLGQVEAQRGQWELAQQYSDRALQQAQAQSNELMQYQWAWQLGRIARHRFQQTGQAAWYGESQAAYRLALNALKSLRSDLVTVAPELQVSFRSAIEPVYREYVDLLLDQPEGQNREMSHNASARKAHLQEAIDTVEALRLAELDNYLQDACLITTSQSVAEIDPGAAVVYPIILGDRLEVIVSRPQGEMSRFSLPVTQAQLDKTVKAFREGLVLRSQRDFRQPGQQLFQWLIHPIQAELQADGVETLVFVPDGALKTIPLAALWDGDQYLIEKFQVATAPGIELLSSRMQGRGQATSLVAGVTEENQGFFPLPFVSQELNDVQAAIPGQALVNEQFTRQSLTEQLEQDATSIVHIATHGQFSSKASETFVLAWDERISLEQLGDILNRRAQQQLSPIELLVLSACETAVGDDASALGLAGMAVRSGARSTLASLWSVNDQSTAALMAEFYQQLAQPELGKAEALRQTQLAMLRDPVYRHPYYWSAFTLLGDWQ